MITHKQLSLADIFSDCIAIKVRLYKFDNDKYEFLELLENTINLDEIVPASFVSQFHAAIGRVLSIFSIRCSGLCYYSLFSRFQPLSS